MMHRRNFTRTLAASAAALALASPMSWAQERFPSSQVTIVVPFPAGGANDFVARAVGQSLAEAWKVPVVVENRVGAAGNIAAEHVARAPANGHTVLLAAVSVVTNPPLYKIPSFVPRVLTPIGAGVSSHLVTIARSDFPARDVPAMLALASTGAGLNAASAGAGTLSHLGLELLASDHKVKLAHIPYKGSAPALNDVMGAQVDIMIDTIATAAPLIASGKVKALAVHSPRRSSVLPNVPTYEEQGVGGMTFSAWNQFLVPSGTPADRVMSLNAAFARAMREPAVAKALGDRGLDVILQSPAETLEFMRSDAARWEKVIRERNVSL
jgi:tripartite-type tricarboxylate transporter receptor subunit TctC